MRLGVALVYMRDSADCKPYSTLIFSLTQLTNLFDKSDFFQPLAMKNYKILQCELLC